MNVREKLAAWTGIPEDVAAGGIRVTLCGRGSVLLENHRGLTVYSDTRVQVRARQGCVTVEGTDLALCRMAPETLQIRGCIRSVTVE